VRLKCTISGGADVGMVGEAGRADLWVRFVGEASVGEGGLVCFGARLAEGEPVDAGEVGIADLPVGLRPRLPGEVVSSGDKGEVGEVGCEVCLLPRLVEVGLVVGEIVGVVCLLVVVVVGEGVIEKLRVRFAAAGGMATGKFDTVAAEEFGVVGVVDSVGWEVRAGFSPSSTSEGGVREWGRDEKERERVSERKQE
jgi:hypothetical protein